MSPSAPPRPDPVLHSKRDDDCVFILSAPGFPIATGNQCDPSGCRSQACRRGQETAHAWGPGISNRLEYLADGAKLPTAPRGVSRAEPAPSELLPPSSLCTPFLASFPSAFPPSVIAALKALRGHPRGHNQDTRGISSLVPRLISRYVPLSPPPRGRAPHKPRLSRRVSHGPSPGPGPSGSKTPPRSAGRTPSRIATIIDIPSS